MSLELLCPVGEMMNFIQQKNGGATLRARFRHSPAAVPKTRKGGIRFVAGSIHRGFAKLAGDIEKQRGFAYLTRSSQKLNPARSRFPEAFEECLPGCLVV